MKDGWRKVLDEAIWINSTDQPSESTQDVSSLCRRWGAEGIAKIAWGALDVPDKGNSKGNSKAPPQAALADHGQ